MTEPLLLLIPVYLALALIFLAVRAMHCISTYSHFDFSVEMLGALVWPFPAIYWIWNAALVTRKHPRPW
jgi:hypothetical protein